MTIIIIIKFIHILQICLSLRGSTGDNDMMYLKCWCRQDCIFWRSLNEGTKIQKDRPSIDSLSMIARVRSYERQTKTSVDVYSTLVGAIGGKTFHTKIDQVKLWQFLIKDSFVTLLSIPNLYLSTIRPAWPFIVRCYSVFAIRKTLESFFFPCFPIIPRIFPRFYRRVVCLFFVNSASHTLRCFI